MFKEQLAKPVVTLEMHNKLGNLIEEHDKENQAKFDRITTLENQIEVMKQMSAPKDDGGPGIIDALNNVSEKIRREQELKMNGLVMMIQKLEDNYTQNKKDVGKEMEDLRVAQNEFKDNAFEAIKPLQELCKKLDENKVN